MLICTHMELLFTKLFCPHIPSIPISLKEQGERCCDKADSFFLLKLHANIKKKKEKRNQEENLYSFKPKKTFRTEGFPLRVTLITFLSLSVTDLPRDLSVMNEAVRCCPELNVTSLHLKILWSQNKDITEFICCSKYKWC